MSLLFGTLTQDFVHFVTILMKSRTGDPQAIQDLPHAAAAFRTKSARDANYLVYIGLAMFVCTYIYMNTWVYTGEVNSKRIRERYLRAVLRQDIAFFDKVGAGEIATRIQTDTHLVQQGMSEKVALVVNFLAAFTTGYILAYVKSWRLALALTVILPAIGITGAVMNMSVAKFIRYSRCSTSISHP
jgi:ATP-binding cassette subfamily B (MDR/TAP) protein 1